jgi:hypothetical protein
MTPQARCDYLAGMVALIQNHDDRIATTDRMVLFLRDVCTTFDETRFRQRVLDFHEAFAAERIRQLAERTKSADAATAQARAAKLRRKLAHMFDAIEPNARRTSALRRLAS